MITTEQQPPIHETIAHAVKVVDSACLELTPQSLRRDDPVIRMTELEQTGRANCIGYTLVASEALSAAGVTHQVACANEHATIIVPYDDKQYLLDPLSPVLRQRVDDKLLLYKDRTPTIQTGWLNRLQIIDVAAGDKYTHKQTAQHFPWLDSPIKSRGSDQFSFQYNNPSVRNLIISMFNPAEGRESLKLYGEFRDAYNQRDIERASQAIIATGNAFPDIDLRNPFGKMVTSIVKRLAIAGRYEQAEETTEAFFSNFEISTDSRSKECKADCLRYIAQQSGRTSLAKHALQLYQLALQDPRSFKQSIKNKERLCSQLV